MQIERMYSEFLDSKNEDYKKKYKGLEKSFSASSAGHCYKKHMFKVTEAPQKEIEARSQRILRLGTLVHQDFEDAIKYYTLAIEKNPTNYKLYSNRCSANFKIHAFNAAADDAEKCT